MQRTGLSAWLVAMDHEGALLGHPHNAYLEMLLDSGLIGLLITLALYGTLAAWGGSLIRDRRHSEYMGVGAMGLALVLAQLVGALTGQSFWPHETTVGMWCAGGLLLRVWVQRSRLSDGALDSELERDRAEPTEVTLWSLGGVHHRWDGAWWESGGVQGGHWWKHETESAR